MTKFIIFIIVKIFRLDYLLLSLLLLSCNICRKFTPWQGIYARVHRQLKDCTPPYFLSLGCVKYPKPNRTSFDCWSEDCRFESHAFYWFFFIIFIDIYSIFLNLIISFQYIEYKIHVDQRNWTRKCSLKCVGFDPAIFC